MAKKRKLKGKRFTKAHSDGKISTTKKSIAKVYKLPPRSIRLVKPDGRQMRANAKISTLRAAWD